MLKWTGLSLAVFVLDQLTKQLAAAKLTYAEPLVVMPFFNLTLVYNTGAAFSFLAQAGGWQRWFFAGIALVVSVGIIYWLKRLDRANLWEAAGLSLVLGGAVGNLWDRMVYGHVIDFLDFHYQVWHWPAFNVADISIFIGAALLIVDTLRSARKT